MIVVDTCVVIWLAKEPAKLSNAATEAILSARRNGGLSIAGVTLYEIAWLARNNRIAFDSVGSFLSETESNFIVLPVTASIARLAAELPSNYPGDPMDRLIGATALDRGVPLITRDRAIRESNALNVIW